MARLKRYLVTYGSCGVLVEDTSAAAARVRVRDEWERRFPARKGKATVKVRPATLRDEELFRRAGVAAWPKPREGRKAA